MNELKKLLGVSIVVCGLIFFPAAVALSEDMCEGNFDYDKDVDGTDASLFKSDFGRSGFNEPCPPDGPAPPARTGQNIIYAVDDDGSLQRGVQSPIPRFVGECECASGACAFDRLTGVAWSHGIAGPYTWNVCVEVCAQNGDGWALANLRELLSLLNYNYYNPALSNAQGNGPYVDGDPFFLMSSTDVVVWTSTTCATGSQYAWAVNIHHGVTDAKTKTESHYCWCAYVGPLECL